MVEIDRRYNVLNFDNSLVDLFRDFDVIYGSIIPCFIMEDKLHFILETSSTFNGGMILTDKSQLMLRYGDIFSNIISVSKLIFGDNLTLPDPTIDNSVIVMSYDRYIIEDDEATRKELHFSILLRVDDVNDVDEMVEKINTSNNYIKLIYLSVDELEDGVNLFGARSLLSEEQENIDIEGSPLMENFVKKNIIGIDENFYDIAVIIVKHKEEIEHRLYNIP